MNTTPATVVDGILPDGPPAPAGRAGTEELAQVLEAAHHSPILRALLDWIDGTVLVLNRQRQILLARTTPATPLGDVTADQMVGRRLGEVLGCRYSDVGEDGCGTSHSCRFCGALRAVVDSSRLEDPVDSQCLIHLTGRDGPESVKFRVRASRAGSGEHEFTVVVLEPFDARPPATDPTQTAEAHDWPRDIRAYFHVRRLGSGGMGSVFLVQDDEGQRYALKTLRAGRAGSTNASRRFIQEMKLTSALDHPNITRTLEYDSTQGGVLYMITEYVPNGTAGRWLQEMGPLPVDLVLYWMLGVNSGLRHAWEHHDLIHRDIKPENLLIDETNHAKMADFGIARSLTADHRLTIVGGVVGTPQFMAPEQATGEDTIDTRADLYALGSTIYYLLSGTYPFDGPDPIAIMTQKVNGKAPSLGRRRRGLPRKLVALVDTLLAMDPDGRPADPAELEGLLTDLVAREGVDLAGVPSLQSPL